jgi:hypothetical protein
MRHTHKKKSSTHVTKTHTSVSEAKTKRKINKEGYTPLSLSVCVFLLPCMTVIIWGGGAFVLPYALPFFFSSWLLGVLCDLLESCSEGEGQSAVWTIVSYQHFSPIRTLLLLWQQFSARSFYWYCLLFLSIFSVFFFFLDPLHLTTISGAEAEAGSQPERACIFYLGFPFR